MYSEYRRQIAEHFAELHELVRDENERAAVDYLHDAYTVVLDDMEKVFTDPNEIAEAVRMKLLDPAYEEWMLSELESALKVIDVIVERRRQELDAWRSGWTRWTPIVVPVSVVLAVALLLFSRRSLQGRFVAPLRNLVDGTIEISRGNLEHRIPIEGVEEIRQLASTFGEMTSKLAESQRILVESERQAALGALVPVVAHNIRNPLASIRATAQMMDEAGVGEDLAESRRAIIDTVDRLERWVTALLSYLVPLKAAPARVPARGRRAGRPRAARTEDRAQGAAGRARGLGAGCAASGRPRSAGAGDPRAARQRGGGHRRRARESASALLEAKMRSSSGSTTRGLVSPSSRTRVSFPPGRAPSGGGYGLGIPVAWKICQTHGGAIDIRRRDEGGTRVTVSLPLAAPQAEI